ncbi:MAG: DUF4249 domain-containing protein [Rhodothermaceae bacterium]|nr:DUF4249 domain-containing protein [Rhodothermaceae bacterium]MXZ17891.1 DUF4249 domain-containing protein [Rhodothermaceae bacterium]MYE64016.1 DUF4249 domain-containing protein [Rhodothermaceae bacterium]MYG68760.1 DUF4249 domain-containing protein [Rhodothermaceae bacterium]MYJ20350.1 DUF4249 domain-containing protein [Rhodothermaceae bacterium]
MHRAFYIVISLAVVSGCESLLDVDFQYTPSEIVVIAPFTEDIPWQVTLQKTSSIHDPTPKPDIIEDAIVKIQGDDGSSLELSHWGGGFFTSPEAFPHVGVTYTLTVEVEGYERIEAVDRIPDPVVVNDVRIFDPIDTNTGRRFEIEIQDDGDVDNYYELAITNSNLHGTTFKVTNSELEDQMRSFAIQDPLLPDITQPEINRALIRDSPFNGDTFVISFTEQYPRYSLEPTVYIRTVSRAHYEYYRSQIIQENSNNLPFAEPARVQSNISNGQGVFAGYHRHTHGAITYQSILNRLVGNYTATRYEGYDDDQGFPTDYLGRGASISLTLNSDYSVVGQMHFPPIDGDSSTDQAELVSLNGGYSVQGYDSFYGYYILTFYHSSDTILRDLQFIFRKDFAGGDEYILLSRTRESTSAPQGGDGRVVRTLILLEKDE